MTNCDQFLTKRADVLGDLLTQFTIHLDSTATRDQFNWARIRNAAGTYYSNRKSKFYLDALIEHGYWNFQNLGVNRDTNEISFVTNARIKIKDFRQLGKKLLTQCWMSI